MVRSELAAAISAAHPGLSVQDSERTLNTIIEAIVSALAAGGRVELRGFGSFSVRSRDARDGRNPRNGDTVAVTAKLAPFFKPGKDLRARVIESVPKGSASGPEHTLGKAGRHSIFSENFSVRSQMSSQPSDSAT